MEKLCHTKTSEQCTDQLANTRRLENIWRNHLQSRKKLETEMEKLCHSKTLELCTDQFANTRRLEIISKNHWSSAGILVTDVYKRGLT